MRTEHEKVLDILFAKRVDIDDLLDSEDYDDFKQRTVDFYYSKIKGLNVISLDSWLKQWLPTEEEYNFIIKYHTENYGD